MTVGPSTPPVEEVPSFSGLPTRYAIREGLVEA